MSIYGDIADPKRWSAISLRYFKYVSVLPHPTHLHFTSAFSPYPSLAPLFPHQSIDPPPYSFQLLNMPSYSSMLIPTTNA